MGQQLRAWKYRDGEKRWLSMLVGAMEDASRPEIRKIPCDPRILTALRARLARPASCRRGVWNFSLRN